MSVAQDARIDLNLLGYFLAVAEASSFSVAATKLGVKGSSVSRGVAALEAALGVQLFTRTTRRVSLTQSGVALQTRLGPGISSVADAIESLRDDGDGELRGTIRMTAPHDLGVLVLPHILTMFGARHPGVRVDLLISNRQTDLAREDMDLAIRATEARTESAHVVSTRICTNEFFVFAAPSYLARAGRPAAPSEAVRDHSWIRFRPMKLAAPFDGPMEKVAVVADDLLFVREAVVHGVGLAALPPFLVRDQLREGTVVGVFPGICVKTASLWLVSPPARHTTRRVRALKEHLLNHLAAELSSPA